MKRLFGTNGIRDVVNKAITPSFVAGISAAIAAWYGDGRTLAIGMDGRTSSDGIVHIASGTLAMNGINVVELGMAPTPAIQHYVKSHSLDGGIIITASHNPPEFNGIKCLSKTGSEIEEEEELKIEEIYFGNKMMRSGNTHIGSIRHTDAVNEEYISAIVKRLYIKGVKRKLRVIIDGANSVGSLTSPQIVELMGHIPITINGNIQGSFPGRNPEPVKENLSLLVNAVKSLNADLGVAHDGDADRAIFVDNEGTYISGEVSMALLARNIIKEHGGGVVVTPISTSTILEKAIKDVDGKVIYSKIGAPAVSRLMKSSNAIFGGEENGGLIFPEHLYARDGGMSLAYMLKILSEYEGTSRQLFDTIKRVGFSKLKVRCEERYKEPVIKKVEEEFSRYKMDKTDGLKIYMDDGWMLVRASGTEPIIRVYVEAGTDDKAKEIGENCVKLINRMLAEENQQ